MYNKYIMGRPRTNFTDDFDTPPNVERITIQEFGEIYTVTIHYDTYSWTFDAESMEQAKEKIEGLLHAES